jgi:hypothetical protein
VNSPAVEMVPVLLLPPVTPFTCQVAAVLLLFCTVAVKGREAPVATLAEVGEIEMLTGAVMVTTAEADLLVSACAMALTVTAAGLGTLAGAVYRPVVEMVPVLLLPPVTPFTCQVAAVLLVFRTVAVKGREAPVATLAEVGEIEILTVLLRFRLGAAPVAVSATVDDIKNTVNNRISALIAPLRMRVVN